MYASKGQNMSVGNKTTFITNRGKLQELERLGRFTSPFPKKE